MGDVCDFLSIHVIFFLHVHQCEMIRTVHSRTVSLFTIVHTRQKEAYFFRKANIFHAYFGSKFGNERGSPMRINMRSVSLLFSGEVSCAFISSAIQLLECVEYAYLCMRSIVACCGGRVNAFFLYRTAM